MVEQSDTHRRAALRGREAVALSRIKSGVWAARVFAVIVGVLTIVPLVQTGGPDWVSAFITLALAASLVVAAQRMQAGSELASRIVLGLFVLMKLTDWLVAHQPVYSGLIWTVIIFAALCNGVWGTFSLASVKRDALTVPPAPPRMTDQRGAS